MPELSPELVLQLLACFVLGSIPFAVLSMRGSGIDILHSGSGNPGFNNVLRFSKWRAIVTLVGDLGKGLLAVWLFQRPGQDISTSWLFGLAVVLGHCYSPFLKFNGGKGIATSAGVMIFLYPKYAWICLFVFTILRIAGGKRKWVEAGAIASLGAWALFVLILAMYEPAEAALCGAAMLLFLTWRHKKNMRILFSSVQAH